MNPSTCSRLLVFVVLSIVFSGCVGYSTPVPLLPDDSLVTGKPCSPPCWQNVTPGQSTWKDVSQFLEVNPFVKGNYVSKATATINEAFTQFWWWINESQDSQRMNMFAIDKQGRLSAITLIPNTTITIQQIIQKYGVPALISAAASAPGRRRGVVFTALYVKQQLEVNWFEEVEKNRGHFCPALDVPVYQASYYSPTLIDASENRLRGAAPHEGFALFDGNSVVSFVNGEVQLGCFDIP